MKKILLTALALLFMLGTVSVQAVHKTGPERTPGREHGRMAVDEYEREADNGGGGCSLFR